MGWHVPKGLEFPMDSTLRDGWRMWVQQGLLARETLDQNGITRAAPIRPFRRLDPKLLPVKAKRDFQLHWKKIFEMMEEAPDLQFPPNSQVTNEFVESSYETAAEYLKTRVSFTFNNKI
jgi:hypothetical protein